MGLCPETLNSCRYPSFCVYNPAQGGMEHCTKRYHRILNERYDSVELKQTQDKWEMIDHCLTYGE